MFPRVLKFSDLSSGIARLRNGEVEAGCVSPDEEGQPSRSSAAAAEEEEDDTAAASEPPPHQPAPLLPFCSRSIQVAASTVGMSHLTPEVTSALATELSYKVKQLLFASKMILHKNKQESLTKSDVRKSIAMLGGADLFGHVLNEEPGYVHIPQEDIYVPDDADIDLLAVAYSKNQYRQPSEPYIQGQWLLPDGYPGDATPDLSSYYLKLSKAIISGKPSHLQVVLKDLQSNPKIGPYCPYFLNLVALTVKKVQGYSRDISLTNALIATAHAIAHNRFVEPSPYLAVNRAANSLLKIVIEDVVHENYDDLAVRVRAGLLLAKMIKIWTIELQQQVDIIKHLLQYLFNSSVPLQSHYGAIVTLAALDERTLDFDVCPVMEAYLPMLDSPQYSNNSIMVQYIVGAILAALRITRNKGHRSPDLNRKLADMEQLLYSRFGDSVVPVRNAWLAGRRPLTVKERGPCRSTPPYSLRLVLRRNTALLRPPVAPWTPVDSVFDLPRRFLRNPAKLPKAVYFDSSAVRWKPFTYCVAKNLNFVKRQHLTSPAGDLFINL